MIAKRPVFISSDESPFFKTLDIEFVWNGELSKSQKRKNIKAIHEAFTRQMPGRRVLEISTKSMQEGGVQLSAFSLRKFVPELGESLPVECIYQASKVFQYGGPYRDLLYVSPHDAKTDERLQNSGTFICGSFGGKRYSSQSSLYDYLYMNALLEKRNEELAEIVKNYDAFTDIEFNPKTGVSCQAKAAAAFVSLTRNGKIEQVLDPDSFLALYLS